MTSTFPVAPLDLRLVVADMDGTLLDPDGRIPDALWPLLERLRERGVRFVPASGRQHATLAGLFAPVARDLPIIAENGAFVSHDGVEVSSALLSPDLVRDVVRRLRELEREGADLGTVLCGKRSAYVERADRAFVGEVGKYYAALAEVDDLDQVDDDILKVAVFVFGDPADLAAPALAALGDLGATHQVVVSSDHWVDVMVPGVTKGQALHDLQTDLGITAAQTAVFGDYLNDLEMMAAGDLSFAMANAHPRVLEAARYRAPSNAEAGVITTVTRLLDLQGTPAGGPPAGPR